MPRFAAARNDKNEAVIPPVPRFDEGRSGATEDLHFAVLSQ
jgi:hypothetical protein